MKNRAANRRGEWRAERRRNAQSAGPYWDSYNRSLEAIRSAGDAKATAPASIRRRKELRVYAVRCFAAARGDERAHRRGEVDDDAAALISHPIKDAVVKIAADGSLKVALEKLIAALRRRSLKRRKRNEN